MDYPKGNNSLNSRGIFEERKKYNDVFFPASVIRKIDMWYDKNLFGKVDRFNNPVSLKTSYVRQVSVDNNIYSINFVADAFFQITREFREKERRGRITLEGSVFADLEPKKGFLSLDVEYEKFLKMLYGTFTTSFLEQGNNREKLFDFPSFVGLFQSFLTNLSDGLFFTKSSFALSKYCSPLCSGLAVEIAAVDHSQDDEKYKKFIADPNFDFFQKTAKKYGFYVDKNAPWRLVANINSPQMLGFMKKYSINDKDELFDKAYDKVSKNELFDLKSIMVRFYNSYVSANPRIRITTRTIGGKKCYTDFVRRPIGLNDASRVFTEASWIRFYAGLRQQESVSLGGVNIEDLESVSTTALSIFSVLGEQKAVAYINSKFKFSTETKNVASQDSPNSE